MKFRLIILLVLKMFKALQDDPELISTIVKENPKLFQYASKNLKSNKLFIIDLIEDSEALLKKIFNLFDKSLINDQILYWI